MALARSSQSISLASFTFSSYNLQERIKIPSQIHLHRLTDYQELKGQGLPSYSSPHKYTVQPSPRLVQGQKASSGDELRSISPFHTASQEQCPVLQSTQDTVSIVRVLLMQSRSLRTMGWGTSPILQTSTWSLGTRPPTQFVMTTEVVKP